LFGAYIAKTATVLPRADNTSPISKRALTFVFTCLGTFTILSIDRYTDALSGATFPQLFASFSASAVLIR
jgi:hypothetical protein